MGHVTFWPFSRILIVTASLRQDAVKSVIGRIELDFADVEPWPRDGRNTE